MSAFASPLVVVLAQLYDAIESLPDDHYTAKPVGPFASSIGAHVRHCLDHVRALLDHSPGAVLDYDHRRRGVPVEFDRFCSLSTIAEYQHRLMDLPARLAARPVTVATRLTADGPSSLLESSISRELAFVISHTVHHQALIAAMIQLQGGSIPRDFGYAPSTLAARRQEHAACAHSA